MVRVALYSSLMKKYLFLGIVSACANLSMGQAADYPASSPGVTFIGTSSLLQDLQKRKTTFTETLQAYRHSRYKTVLNRHIELDYTKIGRKYRILRATNGGCITDWSVNQIDTVEVSWEDYNEHHAVIPWTKPRHLDSDTH